MLTNFWLTIFLYAAKKLKFGVIVMHNNKADYITAIHFATSETALIRSMHDYLADSDTCEAYGKEPEESD
jgi:hypothetical protein